MNFDIDDVVDRRWLVQESSLDDEQYKIRNLKSGNYIIDGGAGSGKTVLALHKAKELEEMGESDYLIVLYTVALKSFVEGGLTKLKLDPSRVCIYAQLDNSGFTTVDYLIIDEVQDFSEDELRKLTSMFKKNLILFGDDAQQLYKKGLNLVDVGILSGIPSNNHKKLLKNYRLPKAIARFASHIKNDTDLVNSCVKDEGELPRIIKCSSLSQELKCIKKIIESEYWRDVGILVDTNKQLLKIADELKKLGLEVEYKVNNGKNNDSSLDFYSPIPKLMTYHSSKGLEFEHVFMPSCEINTSQLNYQQAVYVATTRASETLDILYSNNLSPFIAKIPRNLGKQIDSSNILRG
ncbi:3'-5' exonuclease [Paenibacillus sp. FSL F4-0087]|uniref:3'-5' exonuclease n=1 Tax=Paenibacillus sp. FSL F4-0087 TaxID=2921368 RepID=UPI00096F2D7B|nr:hypothetical protein BK122_30630 [Paenibacillus pabuli]